MTNRGLFHELYRDRRYDTVQNLVWDWTVLNKGENRAGDGHQPLDVHTAPTAKVQDEKTEVQQQQVCVCLILLNKFIYSFLAV